MYEFSGVVETSGAGPEGNSLFYSASQPLSSEDEELIQGQDSCVCILRLLVHLKFILFNQITWL